MKKTLILTLICTLSGLNLWAQDFDSAFGQKRQLQDTEMAEAATYDHAARNQRIEQENCDKLNERMKSGAAGVKIHGEISGCDPNDDMNVNAVGQSFKGGFGKTLEAMAPAVSKMYSVVLGMPGMSKITQTLNKQKAIAKGVDKKKGYASEIAQKNKVNSVIGEDANGNKVTLYETKQDGYFADKDGNIFDAEGKACQGPDCAKIKEEYAKEKEKKEREDWCAKIPMASELAGGAIDIFNQAKSEENMDQSNIQKSSLQFLKETHKTKQKSAQVKAAGWFATSACYIGYAVGGSYTDWKLYLKMGAAGFLGTFYQLKVKKHKVYAAEVQKLIDELPKAGNCNPHTDTFCFCNEPTSQQQDPANYQKYCVPQVYANNPNGADAASCVDKNMNLDHDCSCTKNGSCFHHEMKKTMPIGMDLSNSFSRSALDGAAAVGAGNVGNAADFASKNGNKFAARTNQILKNNESKMPGASRGTDPNLVRKIMSMGIPKRTAAKLASMKNAGGAMQLASSAISGLDPKKALPKSAIESGKVKLSNSGFDLGSKKESAPANPYARLMGNRRGSRSGKKGGVKIENWQNQAAAEAQISKNTTGNLFDIISNRYTTSAWQRFDVYTNSAKESQK